MVQYQNWGIQEWENNVQARIRKAGHGMQTGPVVNGGSHAIIDERADSRKGLGRPIRLSGELPEEEGPRRGGRGGRPTIPMDGRIAFLYFTPWGNSKK